MTKSEQSGFVVLTCIGFSEFRSADRLPIPHNLDRMQEVENLVKQIMKIKFVDPHGDTKILENQIDQLVLSALRLDGRRNKNY